MHVPQRLVPNRQATHRRTPWPRTLATAVALAATALIGSALAQAANPTVQVRYDAKLGTFLTDANGMTLYTFANDAPGKSNCNGGCATAWPPLTADSASAVPLNVPGSFSVITRDDGSKQVAYNGMPLYTWQGDKEPGDTTGQGFRGTWWVANLEPAVQVLKTASGDLLVGPTGKTLYTFGKDSADTSACTGTCAANWPPLVGGYDPAHGHPPTAGKGVSGTLGTMLRADGSVQLTLNGKPLYYFRGDTAPGQTTGDGLLGQWQTVAQP
ncbi:MAG: hypothetical protein P8Y05_15570 [Deinococcales bacterium]